MSIFSGQSQSNAQKQRRNRVVLNRLLLTIKKAPTLKVGAFFYSKPYKRSITLLTVSLLKR